MDDVRTYLIRIRGPIDEDELNARSPLHLNVEARDAQCTEVTLNADQAAVIGVLRHLHGMGFVLLSVEWAVPDLKIHSINAGESKA
jgi:hypothetical protein